MARKDLAGNMRFQELCSDLNLDPTTKEEALKEYYRIKDNYTLEGDPVHWVACALYEACRRRTVPTVENGEMEGNGVSLTRLLRTAKLSLIQFFNKIKKWADMANLPESFRRRVDKLERNFSVSTVIFKKYRPIFISVFRDPDLDPPKAPRSRKQRAKPCTPSDIYEFIWRMFVLAKGNFPDISDDLVNCYHLLLCVIDWVYINCVVGKRTDLINQEFCVPSGVGLAPVPCIISQLCSKHDGLEVEAKGIKEHHFKAYVRRIGAERALIRGTPTDDYFVGVLDLNFFEDNCKAIDRAYEEYVLTLGDFDERIFLGKDADIEIGTPAKQPPAGGAASTANMDGPTLLLEAAARSNADAKLQEHLENTRSLCPKTPLTGRHHLPDNHTEPNVTPISTATQGVAKLQSLLMGRKHDTLSDNLLKMFAECSENPLSSVEERVKSMGEIFCEAYAMPCNNKPGSQASFAQNRLQFASMLYYKVLESIMSTERRRLKVRAPNKPVDLSSLLEQDIFHRSLFACCLEVVVFSYNSQRVFPWVLAVFDLQPYHFYKVIELLIRAEDGFSRDVIKHLNSIEESILDCLAWKSDSPLWDYIHYNAETNKWNVPRSEDVSLQQQPVNPQHPLGSPLGSPMTHPQIRRVAMSDGKLITNKKSGEMTIYSPGSSPSRAPLASDRFSSPVSGTARRRLFPSAAGTASPGQQVTAADGHSPALKQHIITFQQASTDDGRQILIPVQIVQNVSQKGGASGSGPTTPLLPKHNNENNASSGGSNKSVGGTKAKKLGSLGLFFRKVYHLASVRLKDLCDRLGADDQLRRRVWTTFEHSMVSEIKLMKDRHLDQFIMCAVYSICKVSGNDQSFQDIMKCYRLQPQAQSHIYRSVLLKKLHTSQPSSQQSATDNLSQQSTDSDSSDRIQDRLNNLRSSSTLPLSQPESCPPTPTRVSGASTVVYENEERGDLIKFYNSIYVLKMKGFILQFQGRDPGSGPALSALPSVRQHQTSPRRVSNKHSIYVSPHKRPPTVPSGANNNNHVTMGSVSSAQRSLLTPNSRLLYCFNSSPAKDLRAINNMLKMGERKALNSLAEKRKNGGDIMEGAPAIKAIKF